MDVPLIQIIEQLERHLNRRLRVVEMAALAGLSPSRFAHLFRLATGLPPARYFRNLRLERARDLLEATTLSVAEVRIMVGGSESSHFARDYRARHGVTPRDSRDARKKGNGTVSGRRMPIVNRQGDPSSKDSENNK